MTTLTIDKGLVMSNAHKLYSSLEARRFRKLYTWSYTLSLAWKREKSRIMRENEMIELLSGPYVRQQSTPVNSNYGLTVESYEREANKYKYYE